MRTEEYYQRIQHAINELLFERERINRAILAQLPIEISQNAPLLSITDMIKRVREIEAKIIAKSYRLPCQSFIDRFGFQAHEMFREKYPINRDTKMLQVPMYNGEYWHTRPSKRDNLSFGPPSPIAPRADRVHIRFEQWAWSQSSQRWFLAYDAEENIVFVGMRL